MHSKLTLLQQSACGPSLAKCMRPDMCCTCAALSQREQIKALGDLFLRRRLMYKGERKFGKKPGRKRPVKWPKTLKPVVDFVRPNTPCCCS